MQALATPLPPISPSSLFSSPCAHRENWAAPSYCIVSPPTNAQVQTMRNSERARFYRQRNKQRAIELMATVKELRAQVRRLSLTAQLTRSLVSNGVSLSTRRVIMATLSSFFSSPRVALVGFDVERVDLSSAGAFGSSPSPVVEVSACVVGKHSRATVEAIYPCIPGNSVLLDCLLHSRVAYPTTLRFFFSPGGACVLETREIDWVAGLLGSVGDLRDVAKIAAPLRRLQEVGLRHSRAD